MKTRAFLLCMVLAMGLFLAMGVMTLDSRAAQALRLDNPAPQPAPNSYLVPMDSDVSISYSEAVDPGSVTADTFVVQGMQTGHIASTLAVSGNAIILSPDQPFHTGELVQVSATTETLSLVDGLPPLSPTVWSFTTAPVLGSGFYRRTHQELGESNSLDVALGDLDHDGDLDAFVAHCGASRVWWNTGNAIFIDSGQLLGPVYCSTDVRLGDLDGDGDLDAFTVSSGDVYFGKVWINNGAGVFAESAQNVGTESGSGVALGDVDGDGDLDVIYTRTGGNQVWLNDGNATFVDSGQTLGIEQATDAGLADLDGDGDLDLLITHTALEGAFNRVWVNDGTGVFTDTQVFGAMPYNGVALGDLDADGDLDAFLAVSKLGDLDGPNEIWWNDGTGTFSDSGQRVGVYSTSQVLLGDVDADGDLDAFIANLQAPNEVWMNDGTGTFEEGHSRQLPSTLTSAHLGLGDLNGDGDLDLYIPLFFAPDTAWTNLNDINFLYLPVVGR